MKTILAIALVAILVTSIFTIAINSVDAKQTKADKKAEKAINKSLDKFVNGHFAKYCTIRGNTDVNQPTKLVYNKHCVPTTPTNLPPIARIVANSTADFNQTVVLDGSKSSDADGAIVEYGWSGASFTNDTAKTTSFTFPNISKVTIGLVVTDNNGSKGVASLDINNKVQPTPCKTGEHNENGKCVPDPQPTSCVIGTTNKSKFARVAIIGDTDPSNKDQAKQFKQMKDCQTDILLHTGDLYYKAGSASIFNLFADSGFTNLNTNIACGNHDSCSTVSSWLGITKSYNSKSFFDGKIGTFALDENKPTCGTTQWTEISDSIKASTSWYKIVIQHQPDHTVQSDHGETGDAKCHDTVFQDNHVDISAASHNHNWQRFLIGGVITLVGPPGTHDEDGSLYKQSNKVDSAGDPCLSCKVDNGVLFVDLQIDNKAAHKIIGNVVNLQNKIIDTFQN